MSGLPCRIVLEGEFSERFERVSAGLSLHRRPGYTELSGILTDQAALQSLLSRLFAGGLQIHSIRIGPEPGSEDSSPGPLPGPVAADVVNQLFLIGLGLTGLRTLVGDGAAADRLAHAVGELDDAIRQIRTAALR